MNNLSELRDALKRNNPLVIVESFNGFELRTNIGFFELDPAGFYKDGKLLDNKELKEAMNGKPQTPPTKERKKRMPPVQAAQVERVQAPRKSKRPEKDRKPEGSGKNRIDKRLPSNRKESAGSNVTSKINVPVKPKPAVKKAAKLSTKKRRS